MLIGFAKKWKKAYPLFCLVFYQLFNRLVTKFDVFCSPTIASNFCLVLVIFCSTVFLQKKHFSLSATNTEHL